MQTTTHPLDSKVSVNDLVVPEDNPFAAAPLGRVAYLTPDGWVGVRDSEGRIDEYPLDSVRRG